MSMLAVLLLWQGGTITADEAMAAHRRLTAASSPICPTARSPEEVVVCARSGESRYRLPYPAERGPPDFRMPGAYRPTETDTVAGSCGTVGTGYGCGGGIDVLGLGLMVVTRIVAAVEGTDPEPIPEPPE